MLVGVPKEIKVHESRVALTPEGVFEFTRSVHGSVFYCVANMPGAVPVASTYALTNATLPYALAIANKGWERAIEEDPALDRGLNVHAGKIRYNAVALAHGYEV